MAASHLQFNRYRQMAETLPILTSDYTVPPHVTELGYTEWAKKTGPF